MASKISKECSAIQRGVGEKVGSIVMNVGSFLFGFVFAFYWGITFTLILLGLLPFMGIAGGLLGVTLGSGLQEQMRAYAQSAGYAEQALNAIKVVHTYGQEKLEETSYCNFLERSFITQKKNSLLAGVGLGVMYFVIGGFYAYSFYFGGFLKEYGYMNGDKPYTGGVVLAIMFSIVFGSFGLGGAMPFIKSVQEAKVGGRLAYNTIDHKPSIILDEPNTQIVQRDTMKGGI